MHCVGFELTLTDFKDLSWKTHIKEFLETLAEFAYFTYAQKSIRSCVRE